ncbi:MAG: type II toxin-antitoxin system HicB family antitoxin [Chitinophagaceae bacterium]|nr:type II toxin-antitoxin system HicB family antitoxin [Chitinophagaceae bacterium]
MKLTLVVMKGDEYYVGTVKELPGVISQGSSIEEARENTNDALNDYLDNMRLDNKTINAVLQQELVF